MSQYCHNICSANQLAGFYMMGTLVDKRLNDKDDDLRDKGKKFHTFSAYTFAEQESSKMSSTTLCVASTLINLTIIL